MWGSCRVLRAHEPDMSRDMSRAQGKIVDAWSYGLPVATTVVGAEGMSVQEYQQPAEVRVWCVSVAACRDM